MIKRQSTWLVQGYGLRGVWILLTIFLLIVFVAGIVPRFEELRQVCLGEECVILTITAEEEDVLRDLGLSMNFYAGFHVGVEIVVAIFMTMAAFLIFWHRFDEGIGVLVAFMFVSFGLNYMLETDGAFIRLYPAFTPYYNLLTVLAGLPFVLFFYLFPDGRFFPRWTRYLVVLLFALALLDPLFQAGGLNIPSGQFSYVMLFAVLTCIVVGIWAQINRYRNRSDPMQRQQTKWVVLGLMALFFAMIMWALFIELFPIDSGPARLAFNTVVYALLAILILFLPISIGFSIMRYRLWDIDLVIRRTLVYGSLSFLLALFYLASVVVLQAVFTAISGQQSALAIVISTLAIAALFNPLRHRLQDFIDRRFYRRKYDAAQTLAQFAETARDEVNLEQLSQELLQVVKETMQPEHVSLWLKKH